MKKKSPDMVSCAQQCSECHNICMQTITHCLRKGGKYVDPSHLHALMDCAEICRTCCHFMSRSSKSKKFLIFVLSIVIIALKVANNLVMMNK